MIVLLEEKKKNNIYYLSDYSRSKLFEETYFRMRQKEGRIYPDETVKQLPLIQKDHALFKEWKIRENSSRKIINYFSKFKGLEILDLGSGNCWFANKLSINTENNVYAVDINTFELEQGARLFSNNNRLQIICTDIFENSLPRNSFDAVIIYSALQYFHDLSALINRLFSLINFSGEIHILDSNFYSNLEAKNATRRTGLYYQSLGFPGMIQYYHHPRWEELSKFNFKIMNKSAYIIWSFLKKFRLIDSILFPWIRIKPKDNF